jgi:lipopolysaccharide transport system ATP-binding protein
MAIRFQDVSAEGVKNFTGHVPPGFAVGLIGDTGCGAEQLLALASGEAAGAGMVQRGDGPNLILNQPFVADDAVARELGIARLVEHCRQGGSALVYSHDQALVERVCDEVWWLHEGRLALAGTPREVWPGYRKHLAGRLKAEMPAAMLSPKLRRGDGRAELLAIETLSGETPSPVWTSGAEAAIAVTVHFHQAVEDPVVGVLIRTRVGLDVFGTNTELEGLRLGPIAANTTKRVVFRFGCLLCPQEYTITAASHDPDGVWHDWMEDAVAVTVADTRYTAGVANLRARVEAADTVPGK